MERPLYPPPNFSTARVTRPIDVDPDKTTQSLPGSGGRVDRPLSPAQARMRGVRGDEDAPPVINGHAPAAPPPAAFPVEVVVDEPPAPAGVEGVDVTLSLLNNGPDAVSNGAPMGAGGVFTVDGNVALTDIDHLWSWNTLDAEGVRRFLGWSPDVSVKLHQWFQRLTTLVGRGQAAVYSIRQGTAHVGFIMLLPIVRERGQTPVGTVHIYVAPEARQQLPEILRAATEAADRLAPDITMFVASAEAAWARLLETVGFEAGIHLYRKAKGAH